MVRLIAFLAGLVFAAALIVAALIPRDATTPDLTKKYHEEPREQAWTFSGPMGRYDRAQLQRGFKVYKEVCSACHGLKQVAFRSLSDLGYSEGQVKAIAKGWNNKIPSIDEKTGEANTRDALPFDHLLSPFANDTAARAANNNALPPDLSLMAKGREDGTNYIHSLLTGFGKTPPKGWEVPTGLYYNPYFANLNIAMPPPLLSEGQVTFDDGTKASVDQMAADVSAFLTWAAEPKLEARHRTGLGAILFLLIMTGLSYLTYRKVWAEVKRKPATLAA